MKQSDAGIKHRSEAELVEVLVGHLKATSAPGMALQREIRSHGRAHTDVCVLENGELMAIEAKCSNWRRAIAQAYLNRFCAETSYIAMDIERINETITREASRFGIGVIGVSQDELRTLVDPQRFRPDPSLRIKILSQFEGSEA